MPDNEDQFDREDLGARARGRGDASGGDINFLPTDPIHLGQRPRPTSNASIHIAVQKNELLPLPLPGPNSDVLRDAFVDAIRFYTQDDELKELLKTLAKIPTLRFEVSTNFPSDRPSDANIAEQLAFSISYLRLAEWEQIQADTISHQACWVTGYGGTTSDFLRFEYCLVVCHHVSTMEELVRKYQKVQQERERIDAERDAWVQSQAQPLLDDMEEQLKSATLPEIDRNELKAMLQSLRHETYYRGMVTSTEAAKIIDRSQTVLRRHARKGSVGEQLADRDFVYHTDDVQRFAEKERPTGGTNRKIQKDE